MKVQQTLQYALLCLCALEEHSQEPLSAQDLSHAQGVPLPDCMDVLDRLSSAGLIQAVDGGRYVLPQPASELRALEVWQAVFAEQKKQPAFQLWVGARRADALQVTLSAVHQAAGGHIYPSESGLK